MNEEQILIALKALLDLEKAYPDDQSEGPWLFVTDAIKAVPTVEFRELCRRNFLYRMGGLFHMTPSARELLRLATETA